MIRWHGRSSCSGDPRGLPRPSLNADRAYAYANVAHQIENLAIGVATTFAFNYPYYEESGQNYGLTAGASDHTPLRSLAAHGTMVSLLSGKSYVGDLPNKDG